LYTKLPIYSIVFIISMFASMGLPGLSGFISEALIFLGMYKEFTTITVLALIGLLIGAAYLLWMFKRMFFGEVNPSIIEYHDMNAREIFYMAPLCILVIVFGIYPAPILNVMKESVGSLVQLLAKFQ
ncbi:MAG: proton-conducting transporter membrane subunit, partial [Bdellovibrionota bacterium]